MRVRVGLRFIHIALEKGTPNTDGTSYRLLLLLFSGGGGEFQRSVACLITPIECSDLLRVSANMQTFGKISLRSRLISLQSNQSGESYFMLHFGDFLFL